VLALNAQPKSSQCVRCHSGALLNPLLALSSQEDMARAEELTTKLRTLSYDHERLRTMHSVATATAEGAEREAAAARAKLT
jgi:hypothetical protein